MSSFDKKILFSTESRKAIYYAFRLAQRNNVETLNIKFLFYGILQADSCIARKLFLTLCLKQKAFMQNKKSNPPAPAKKILSSTMTDSQLVSFYIKIFEKSLSSERKIEQGNTSILLSKNLRTVLFSAIKSAKPSPRMKRKGYSMITTLTLLRALLKNKKFKNWLVDEFFYLQK